MYIFNGAAITITNIIITLIIGVGVCFLLFCVWFISIQKKKKGTVPSFSIEAEKKLQQSFSDAEWLWAFHLQLEIELGERKAMLKAMANFVAIPNAFTETVIMERICLRKGEPREFMLMTLASMVSQYSETDRLILKKYWIFYHEACDRINRIPALISIIKEGGLFKTLPASYTLEVLELACEILEPGKGLPPPRP